MNARPHGRCQSAKKGTLPRQWPVLWYYRRMGIERFIGIDLAWAQGGARTKPHETGVAAIDGRGVVIE